MPTWRAKDLPVMVLTETSNFPVHCSKSTGVWPHLWEVKVSSSLCSGCSGDSVKSFQPDHFPPLKLLPCLYSTLSRCRAFRWSSSQWTGPGGCGTQISRGSWKILHGPFLFVWSYLFSWQLRNRFLVMSSILLQNHTSLDARQDPQPLEVLSETNLVFI